MKIRIMTACAAVALACLGASAQVNEVPNLLTNAPPAPPPQTLTETVDHALLALEGSVSNSYVIPYYLRANGLPKKNGFGVAWCLPVSDYLVNAVRLDYVDGDFWMPSENASLQLPIHLAGGLTVTPFTEAGVGIPVNGATLVTSVGNVTVPGKVRDNNGQPTGILGLGCAVRLYTSVDGTSDLSLVADLERWTGFSGDQYRVGACWHSSKPGVFGLGLNLGVIKL